MFTAEDAQAAREARKAGNNSALDKEDENHLHLHNLLHPSRTHNGHGRDNNKENKDANKENRGKENTERPGAHKRSESELAGWAEKGKNFLFGKKDKSEKREGTSGERKSPERKSGNSSS